MIHFLNQSLQKNQSEDGKNSKRDFALREQIRIEENTDDEYNRKLYPKDATREDVINALERYKKKHNDLIFSKVNGRKTTGHEKIRSKETEEKLRQWIWETSPELRELRQKILIADVTRDQAMQIAEKQALQELRKEEEASLSVAAEEEKKKYEEERRKKELLEIEAKLKYHKDLDDLIKFKASREDATEAEVEFEKSVIDEIRRQIEEEDEERERKRIKAQKELHRQAVELQKVRRDMKLLEKEKEKVYDSKVDEYRKAQELRAKSLDEKKRLDLESKLHLQEVLLHRLEKIYREKSEREQLCTELGIEEKEELEKEKMSAAEAKRRRTREELQKIYDMQMYVKKQKEELQKKEDELFRQNLMDKLFEEERLDNMTQQKRRIKQAEHGRIAQKLLEDEKKRKAAERQKDVSDYNAGLDEEAKRLSIVNEERMKFLEQHAKQLLGYLPKGMFRNNQEIEQLGRDFKKFYNRRNCSSLFQDN